MASMAFSSSMSSELNVTTSYATMSSSQINHGSTYATYPERRHDSLDVFGVQLQHTVEDRKFVITEGFLSNGMELKE